MLDRAILDVIFYSGLLIQFFSITLVVKSADRQSFTFKWLAIYLIFAFVCDAIGRIFFHAGLNPNYVSNLFELLGILILSPFLYHAIKRPALLLPLISINIFYLIFAPINMIYVQGIASINNNLQVVHALLIICLSIYFFFTLLQDLPSENILCLPLFWIISGFLLSYAGKLVIFTITNYMIDVREDNMIVISIFHNTLTLVGYSLIAWGIWLNKNVQRSDITPHK